MPAAEMPGRNVPLTASKLRIVLANGSLAQYPQGGGHWTVFLQYLFGLDALGHDVFWLELLDATGKARDQRLIRTFLNRFHHYGFGRRCALLLLDRNLSTPTLETAEAYGMGKSHLKDIVESADLVWNFCCTLRQPFLSIFKRRALIDLDPGMIQVPALTRDMALFDHEILLTIGSKVGEPDCQIPTLGRTWHRFMPFVYLPNWQAAPDPGEGAPFSSITQWTWDEIWYEKRVLDASKRRAFMRYLDIPQRAARPFELAANIHPKDRTGDRELMLRMGWKLVNPHGVARSPATYQNYIRQSRAEFSCSKPIYRELRTGWFSDRSASYLASGRPVLAEDTGFSEHLPTGRGLLSFNTLEEALAGVAEIDGNYPQHMHAARELAEEYLSSKKWLPSMLSACGW
jgi:hypothetical protein